MFHPEMYRNTFGSPFTGTPYGFGATPFYPHAVSPFSPWSTSPSSPAEITMIRERLDAIQSQLAYLTECLRRSTEFSGGRSFPSLGTAPLGASPYTPYPGNPYLHPTPGYEMSQCARLRESDSLIFWEIFLPKLSLNDVDVEVTGNRIVCRTRTPVSPTDRFWNFSATPRGFEIFELPDGRVEFNWTVPVHFEAKEVEATFREGFLCICIPKCDHAERQSIQVTKEATSSGRKGSAAHQTHAS